MPALASELKFYASTPATGTARCLGGAITATELNKNLDPSNPIYNQFWNDFTNQERAEGEIEYHCIFLKNTNATLTLTNGKLWFSAVTPNPATFTRMGLETNTKSTPAHTIATAAIAPATIDFDTRHNSEAEAILLPSLAPNDYVGIWISIELEPNAPIYNKDWFEIRCDITTPP